MRAERLGREHRLKRVIAEIEGAYDFVIIDNSPRRTLLNDNVLNYVNEMPIPPDPGYWSILGPQHLEELVDKIGDHTDHETLLIGSVLQTKVQKTNVAREVETQV